MATVQQVNIQSECHHRHGPLFLLRPWAWGGPCRRCERLERNVIVVPTAGVNTVTVNPAVTTTRQAAPVVVSTTTTQALPVQQQVVTTTYPSTLPPTYTETVVVN